MAHQIISEVIAYDPTSKTGLRWIAERQRIQVGAEAGCLKPSKRGSDYWVVGLDLVVHRAHRLIWELIHGAIPGGMQVDHIDGNGLNNNIGNLRLVTNSINCRNTATRQDNSTGVTGVRLHIPRNCYEAACYEQDGQRRTKTFSCAKHGKEGAFALAVAWRESRMAALNEEGAGYTQRHLSA
ncbi:HNH endonuclease [Pseudomonas lactis]|uniref:HNH endonuclease n=1 Tax=Pseudomonas lactis TaxID=1615674 RepID=UPI00110C7BCB